MRTWWRCLEPACDAAGVFDQAATGGAAEKHTAQTRHGTMTTAVRARGERWLDEGRSQ